MTADRYLRFVALPHQSVVRRQSAPSNKKTVIGTYADKDEMTLVFNDGKVKNLRSAAETDFTVKDDSLKFQFPGGFRSKPRSIQMARSPPTMATPS